MKPMHSRRSFLEGMGAASIVVGTGVGLGASGGEATGRLAIDGGTPVRQRRLSAQPYGPQFFDDAEKQALMEVLESRTPFRFSKGEDSKVSLFEKDYAAHMGTRYALGVTSGTAALYCAMAALEIGPGDEVILPAWTWYACYDAIVLSGALPVFAEIDESFDIDPGDMERKITPRTKAILAVHLQGCPADMDRITEMAKRHRLRVIEDCAQCVGGRHRGRFVGAIGDIGIYSFQVSKTIPAGEGGAVVTSDPVLFERACRFHNFGALFPPYDTKLQGGLLAAFAACNFRMNEFTGAVLGAQLSKLGTICQRVRANARKVREGIADLPGLKFRKSHDLEGDIGVGVFIDLGTRARRERYLEAMAAEGVPAAPPGGSVILPTAERIANKATLHPAWPTFQSAEGKAMRYGAECCPRTIDVLGRFAGVMIDPSYTKAELGDIIRAIRKVYLGMDRNG